ncbi:MAG: hypothetical protein WKF66_00195 [Pedobacter sp.]
MTVNEFKKSGLDGIMPEGLPLYVQALWHDGRGDWKSAHDLIDQLADRDSSRVHAYLHRKEGDLWNADYWYRRAASKRPDYALEKEWEALLQQFLQ